MSALCCKAITVAAIFSIVTSNVMKPTITNSSGEYYIADESSFRNNTINCNSTRNCYVICPLMGSCYKTMISCSSSICDLICSAQTSCAKTQFNINTNINTSINLLCSNNKSCFNTIISAISSSNLSSSTLTTTCSNITSCFNSSWRVNNFYSVDIIHNNQCNNCFFNKYTLQYIENINIVRNSTNNGHIGYDIYTIINSKNVDMSCNGYFSCFLYEINTNNSMNYASSVSVKCQGDSSCAAINIALSRNDTLDLNCNDGTPHYDVCIDATLMVSPLHKHTNILCNGDIDSRNCYGLNITVPYNYDPDFISFKFANVDGTNVPYRGSFDGVSIECLDHKLCTNYTSFPLLYGAANVSKIIGEKVYYYGNISYQYRFQSLSCKSGEECFIHCDNDETCSNSFIQCEKGSKCHIYFNNSYGCDSTVIKAYGDKIDLHFPSHPCGYTNIWLPQSFINGYLDITSCNQFLSCDTMEFMCRNKETSNFTTSQFIWNGDRYICEKEGCCPWKTNSNDTYGNITCIDTECNVNCDINWGNPYYPPFGCVGLLIDGRASNTLNLNCSFENSCYKAIIYCPMGSCNIDCGAKSCSNTIIYANQTKNLNIKCLVKDACTNASITAYGVDKFNMICSNNGIVGSGGCNHVNLVVDSSNSLDIHCTQCHGLTLQANSNKDVQFLCDGSCTNMNLYSNLSNNTKILCNGAVEFSNFTTVSAENFHVLCEISAACRHVIITSNFTKNVFVDCNNHDGTQGDYSCLATKIYGNAVNKLEINCNHTACIDGYIEATGNKMDSKTSISCNNYRSCDGMEFNINNMSMVSLYCYAWYSCVQSIFNITNGEFLNVTAINHISNSVITNDFYFNIQHVNEILFDCTKGQCSPKIKANDINNINLLCDITNNNDNACLDLAMSVFHVNDSVNIWCNGSYSCWGTQFVTYFVENMVNVTCYGWNSCGYYTSTSLDARYANQLNIFIYNDNFFDNSMLIVYTPNTTNSTNIYCESYGCIQQNLFVKNGLSDINFIFTGKCECNSLKECISEWDINCDNGEHVEFNGNNCVGVENSSCCTNNDIKRIENEFNDYYYGNVSNCYSPTNPPNNDNKPDHGLLIGLVVLAVCLVTFAVIFGILYYRKRKGNIARQKEDYQKINS